MTRRARVVIASTRASAGAYDKAAKLYERLEGRAAGTPLAQQAQIERAYVLWRSGEKAQALTVLERFIKLNPSSPGVDYALYLQGVLLLRDAGTTLLLITHKLKEILSLCDAVTVMRQGAVVGTVKTAETDKAQLAEMMVGRKVNLVIPKAARDPGPVVLEGRGIRLVDRRGVTLLHDLDFTVRAGEIVGVAGVSGNGQSELLDVLSGIRAPTGLRVPLDFS